MWIAIWQDLQMFKNFIYQHEGTWVQDSINTINVNSCLLFSLNINTGRSRIFQTDGGGAGRGGVSPTLQVRCQPCNILAKMELHEN